MLRRVLLAGATVQRRFWHFYDMPRDAEDGCFLTGSGSLLAAFNPDL